MKFPKKFNIFGMAVKLIIRLMPESIAGTYDHRAKTITINELQETDEELLHTVLHECGHALFYRVSINQGVSFEVHEFIVNNYATMLLENFDIKPKIKK